ncbi:MscL family protein [Candidatus Parcubacteria bacterium]|nr:MscL family protein [Candidatus Parcubacteria bacterium]
MRGFIHFLRTQGIVGLAIGFIIGAAVAKTVTALVDDILTPIIGIFLGKAGDISKLTLDIHGVVFKWGDFLSNLINLIIIAAVIYFLFRALKLDTLDEKKESAK